MHALEYRSLRIQKVALEPLQLELLKVMSHSTGMLGTKFRP